MLHKEARERASARSHRTAAHARSRGDLWGSLFRLWLNGGAVVLVAVVFLVTGSLWTLLLLLPYLGVLWLVRRIGR